METAQTKIPASTKQLATRGLVRLVGGFAILAAVFFVSAGTIAYWQAWVYLMVVFVPVSMVFAYLLVSNPALLERRMRTRETHEEQRPVIRFGSIGYVLAFLLPGLDRRFGWSHVDVPVVLAADALFLVAYALFVRVLRENSYASRVVEVEAGQQVVTTGPYAIVRHPMYVAAILICIATPVALGSWWALIVAVPLTAVFVVRIRGEEQVLARDLPGYAKYMTVTRYRLIPGVW